MKWQTSGEALANNDTAWERLKGVQAPWAWSFVGPVLAWFGIVGIFGFGIASNVAQTALTYGVFMVLVGLGQMLVITSGVGNIDLSVPSTIPLAGVVGMHAMGGSNGHIALGVAAALGVGVAPRPACALLRDDVGDDSTGRVLVRLLGDAAASRGGADLVVSRRGNEL